jgi:hypothetical protein
VVFINFINQCHNDRYTENEQNKDNKVRQFVVSKHHERRL